MELPLKLPHCLSNLKTTPSCFVLRNICDTEVFHVRAVTMAERHSLLRLSVPPTTWVLSDRSLGEICFTFRDCATEQPVGPCIPTEVPVGPSLPLSCFPVMQDAYKAWIALLPWRLQNPIASSFPMAMCPVQAHHCVYSLMSRVEEIWVWWTMSWSVQS